MEQITFRDYLQGVPKPQRGKLLVRHMIEYEAQLEASHVPLWFVRSIGFGIRRNALLSKPVEFVSKQDCVLSFDDMDDDEIVRRYENSIQ